MRIKKTALVLLLCLGFRLIFFFAVAPWDPRVREGQILKGDALEYHLLAKNLAENHRFAGQTFYQLDAIRTPGYPLFVGFFYLFFGAVPWIVLLAQILLDSISCALFYLILARLISPKAAVPSAIMYAMDPFLIFHSSTLLSDIPFIFLCLVAFFFIANIIDVGYQKRKFFPLALSAIFFGLATLTRPISLYLPPLIALFLLFHFRGKIKFALKYASVYLLVFAVTIAPWLVRNQVCYGQLSLSTSGAYNLLVRSVAPIIMHKNDLDAHSARKMLFDEADELMARDGLSSAHLNDFQKARYWQRAAIGHLRSEPLKFLKFHVLGMIHTLANLGTRSYADFLGMKTGVEPLDIKQYAGFVSLLRAFLRAKTGPEIAIGLAIGTYLLVTYLLAAVGLITGWGHGNRPILWLSLLISLYFLTITGAAGLARFKLPAIPFYLVFAGMGCSWIIEKIKRGRSSHSLSPVST